MSFICQSCSNPQSSGVKPVKVVLQTRVKVYPVRYRGNVVIDNGGRGVEIVKEANMCKQCAAQHSVHPTQLRCICTQLTALEPVVNPDCPVHGSLRG